MKSPNVSHVAFKFLKKAKKKKKYARQIQTTNLDRTLLQINRITWSIPISGLCTLPLATDFSFFFFLKCTLVSSPGQSSIYHSIYITVFSSYHILLELVVWPSIFNLNTKQPENSFYLAQYSQYPEVICLLMLHKCFHDKVTKIINLNESSE